MAELDEVLVDQLHRLQRELARAELAGEFVAAAEVRNRLAALIDAEALAELLARAASVPRLEGPLRLPVPYYGGKFRAAKLIEQAMGPIVNLVIPFGGSLGCLLGRSTPARVETANDKDGLIVNAWRAIKHDPLGVAAVCGEMSAHERTMWAVHDALLDRRPALGDQLGADPRAFDVELAAWWLWGRSAWLGGGFGNERRRGSGRLALRGGQTGPGIGQGVMSSKIRDDLPRYFRALARRLRHVRLTCGDWTRVLTRSVTTSHGVTGVYLDPCYDLETGRKAELYGLDEPEQSAQVRQWALEHGEHPRMRIVVSGLEGEHTNLEGQGWSLVRWRGRERLWLSPLCQTADFGPLFEGAA